MDDSAEGDIAGMWRTAGSLPSFSRGFNMFLPSSGTDGSDSGSDDGFFVPSYLASSSYVQKLREAHRSKRKAQLESKRSASNGMIQGTSTFTQPLPSGSHRGLSHTVVERPPSFEDGDNIMSPLPTSWNRDDMWSGIDVMNDGLSVKFTGPKNAHEREHEASAVRADHYMPPQCGIYYFEVNILAAKKDDVTVAIGFSTKNASIGRPVGWEPESWGYHGDDGRCFSGQNIGRTYSYAFTVGDVVGCGVNFRDRTAFFTKNGVQLAVAFHELPLQGELFPSISLKKPNEHIMANFGQTPFIFDIDGMMKSQRLKIGNEINNADVSTLEPGLSETDLIQTLVLQFLQHDGYVDTARAFAEDIQRQKEALNVNSDVAVEGINIKDDEDANNRQRIRRAILEGDIDRALKHTNAFYPQVLKDNEEVHFKLRCRKFIEMVRRAAQLRGSGTESKRSNGRGSETSAPSQVMDVDANGDSNMAWTESMNTDTGSSDQRTDLLKFEEEMLQYGQTLGAEYANDQRKEISKALDEIWSLVAYANPLKEPKVSHLLDRKGRVAVAEELNSTILASLGKSSRASLEKMYAQTTVLLEDLRKDGGPGAFVSVQDVVNRIVKLPQA